MTSPERGSGGGQSEADRRAAERFSGSEWADDRWNQFSPQTSAEAARSDRQAAKARRDERLAGARDRLQVLGDVVRDPHTAIEELPDKRAGKKAANEANANYARSDRGQWERAWDEAHTEDIEHRRVEVEADRWAQDQEEMDQPFHDREVRAAVQKREIARIKREERIAAKSEWDPEYPADHFLPDDEISPEMRARLDDYYDRFTNLLPDSVEGPRKVDIQNPNDLDLIRALKTDLGLRRASEITRLSQQSGPPGDPYQDVLGGKSILKAALAPWGWPTMAYRAALKGERYLRHARPNRNPRGMHLVRKTWAGPVRRSSSGELVQTVLDEEYEETPRGFKKAFAGEVPERRLVRATLVEFPSKPDKPGAYELDEDGFPAEPTKAMKTYLKEPDMGMNHPQEGLRFEVDMPSDVYATSAEEVARQHEEHRRHGSGHGHGGHSGGHGTGGHGAGGGPPVPGHTPPSPGHGAPAPQRTHHSRRATPFSRVVRVDGVGAPAGEAPGSEVAVRPRGEIVWPTEDPDAPASTASSGEVSTGAVEAQAPPVNEPTWAERMAALPAGVLHSGNVDPGIIGAAATSAETAELIKEVADRDNDQLPSRRRFAITPGPGGVLVLAARTNADKGFAATLNQQYARQYEAEHPPPPEPADAPPEQTNATPEPADPPRPQEVRPVSSTSSFVAVAERAPAPGTPARRAFEYSVLAQRDGSWQEGNGYTGFTHLVHEAQRASEKSFGVTVNGQLTPGQFERLLEAAGDDPLKKQALMDELHRRERFFPKPVKERPVESPSGEAGKAPDTESFKESESPQPEATEAKSTGVPAAAEGAHEASPPAPGSELVLSPYSRVSSGGYEAPTEPVQAVAVRLDRLAEESSGDQERGATGEVSENREYSILRDRGWVPKDGYTGFSELVHRVQERQLADGQKPFGVPRSNQLTNSQIRTLLEAASTSSELDSLEQEIYRREQQREEDKRRFRPVTKERKTETGSHPVNFIEPVRGNSLGKLMQQINKKRSDLNRNKRQTSPK